MNVAFIPVRGGSKSIPLKNIKPLNGRPLVYWTVAAACGCKYIDKVYVATDSDKIKDAVSSFDEPFIKEKLEVIGRSRETASDTASTESALLEFCGNVQSENVVLVQATSPMLTSDDLDRGFEAFGSEGTDTVLSVVRQKRFNWHTDENGFAKADNYDIFHRPRRQEYDGYLVENGAFYISSREGILKTGNRIWGNIKAVEMPEETFFEIDEPSDWIIIEMLMKRRLAKPDLKNIKMLITDCDGCLTDGGMYYSEKGDELKKFNTRDGMSFRLLKEKGIICGIITGEDMELNRRRGAKMGLDFVEGGVTDKVAAAKRIAEKYGLSLGEIAYVGDELNDLRLIKSVGYSFCPADAAKEVQEAATCVLKTKGGEGIIREIRDMIL